MTSLCIELLWSCYENKHECVGVGPAEIMCTQNFADISAGSGIPGVEPFLTEDGRSLCCVAIIMDADGMATQEARASAGTIILPGYFFLNVPVSTPGRSIFFTVFIVYIRCVTDVRSTKR